MRPLLPSLLALAGACSAAAPEPVPPPSPPRPAAQKPASAAPSAPAPATPDAGDGAGQSAALPPSSAIVEAAPASGPAACPGDMKLVEGDYCTEIEHTCLRSWYDKSNKKTICEEFEPTSRCVGQKVHKRYCIDTYEWPNQKGERPEVMNRFHQAQIKCAAVGKRLCSESEWTFACEGPEAKPFPYGYVRDASKCNGDHPWDDPDMKKVAKRDADELARLWHGVRSGSQPQCISDFGVADMPANTDEVVYNEAPLGRGGKFDSIHTGGPWYKGVRNQCRPKIYTHNEDFYYYFLSFRCCAEADEKPTDPRTARQIEAGWKIERVEKLAQFTVLQMREKLDLKKSNKCECAAHDILCKTMCGTLLGPGAVDATH